MNRPPLPNLALGLLLLATRAWSADSPVSAAKMAQAEKLFWIAETHYYKDDDCRGAVEWYKKAAEQGYAGAMYRLGGIYLSNDCHGPALNNPHVAEAVEWTRKAANEGVSAAMLSLAIFYKGGLAVKKDRAEGQRWMWLAADRGDPQALINLSGHAGMKSKKEDYSIDEWIKEVREGAGDTPEQKDLVKRALSGQGDTVTEEDSVRQFNNLMDYEWYQDDGAPELGAHLLTKEQAAAYALSRPARKSSTSSP